MAEKSVCGGKENGGDENLRAQKNHRFIITVVKSRVGSKSSIHALKDSLSNTCFQINS